MPQAQGYINGHGTYHQFVSVARERTSVPEIDGEVTLKSIGFTHSSLPGPVQNLNGTMKITGNQLDVQQLAGEMGGSQVQIDGLITGKRTFWDDPEVSATLDTKVDLTKLKAFLPPVQAQLATARELSGIAETRLNLTGKLSHLSNARFTGVLNLKNASFSPGFDFMEGKFSDVDAELQWNGKSLILRKFTGNMNGSSLSLSGMLNQEKVSLRMAGVIDLDIFGKTFPKIGKLLKMSGPASYDVTFAAGNDAAPVEATYDPLPMEDLESGSEQLAALFAGSTQLINQAVENKAFVLEGRTEFTGANIRHLAMPPAQKLFGQIVPEAEI